MKTFTVIYRTGGTANFKWNRILTSFKDRQEAIAKKVELEKMGYPSLIHDTHLLTYADALADARGEGAE